MPNLSKKQSKRVSCRQRYKVEKKVRQHLKKRRREARKNPSSHRARDPGVPNSLPFKEDVLREAQVRQQMQEQQRQEMRQRQKEGRQQLLMKNRDLGDLRKDAEKRGTEFEGTNLLKEHLQNTGQGHLLKELNSKCHYQEFRKVVERADVVLEVLDARDPLGTRSPQLEQHVLSKRKRLVLVLNKIDLIPRENLERWLKHLRNELPTLAFKASTQSQRSNLSRTRSWNLAKVPEGLGQSSSCLGANLLMKMLGNYCRNQGIQTCITVGVVGYPNVGKSSIVNSLKRARACTVGAVPGVTKVMQTVQLDKHVSLLDSPGVVMAAQGTSQASVALRNAKRPEDLEDPVGPACSILRRASKEQFMLHYRLPDFSSPEECLSLLARRMGLLRKGGVPNPTAAAKRILTDWNCGRIKYYTEPPANDQLKTHLAAEIVQVMAAEFDIASLEQEEKMELEAIRVVKPSDAVIMESAGTAVITLDTEDASMETDQQPEEKFTVKLGRGRKKQQQQATVGKADEASSALEGLQQNKARRKEFKKQLKRRKRNEKVATTLAKSLESAFSSLT